MFWMNFKKCYNRSLIINIFFFWMEIVVIFYEFYEFFLKRKEDIGIFVCYFFIKIWIVNMWNMLYILFFMFFIKLKFKILFE